MQPALTARLQPEGSRDRANSYTTLMGLAVQTEAVHIAPVNLIDIAADSQRT
jgi:hypothetical protein